MLQSLTDLRLTPTGSLVLQRKTVTQSTGIFFLFADSRRVSCQLLSKEWALNTGKLFERLAQEGCY